MMSPIETPINCTTGFTKAHSCCPIGHSFKQSVGQHMTISQPAHVLALSSDMQPTEDVEDAHLHVA